MNAESNLDFFDSHSHKLESQTGGLLIGLEGVPFFEGTLTNAAALEASKRSDNFLAVHYISKAFGQSDSVALKYHGRREGYTADQVINDLQKRSSARLIVLDTLNEPYWDFRDYWKIIKAFPGKQFVLAHCGGFDIHNFLKILMFESNVWADFAFTQTLFGFTEERVANKYVCDSIRYCLDHPKLSERVFYGSDNPFVSQLASATRFSKEKNGEALLKGDLINLFNLIQR